MRMKSLSKIDRDKKTKRFIWSLLRKIYKFYKIPLKLCLTWFGYIFKPLLSFRGLGIRREVNKPRGKKLMVDYQKSYI